MKLYYFYGTMNSAKSLNLLAKAHQFEEAGSKNILFKPAFDTRDEGVIKTRAGLQKDCHLIHKEDNIIELVTKLLPANSIFVDEAQFLTEEQILQLWKLAKFGEIRVFCYGLKTNFKNELFPASAKLMVLADKVEEIVSKCADCGNKATTHIKVGGTDSECEVGDIKLNNGPRYKSVCQVCYYHKQVK